MKKEFIARFLLTSVFLIVAVPCVMAAPVGIDSINEFVSPESSHYAGYSSYEFRAWNRADMCPDAIGDYSRWSRTYTFLPGEDGNACYPMPDMRFDDMAGIEYCSRPGTEPAPVPEPRTIALLGIGLISAGIALRKRLIRKIS